MGLIFIALAQQGHRLALSQFFEQAKGELLSMVLDARVVLVDGRRLEQLGFVAGPKLLPVDLPCVKGF